MMDQETWLPATEAVELGFADRIDETLKVAARVSAKVLEYKHTPARIAAMAKSSQVAGHRSNALDCGAGTSSLLRRPGSAVIRNVTKKIASAEQRARRRYEMQDLVEAIKADDRAVDVAERAAVRRWQEQLYYDRACGIPLQQSRETFARLEAGRAAGKGRLR